jgi:hypothetical protein
MTVTVSFRIWSESLVAPAIAELAARQESVTGQRCAFAVHREGPDGWLETSAVPAASPTTACTLTRSTERDVIWSLSRDLRPTRTEFVHALRISRTVYFAGTAAGRTDLTLLIQFGISWALAQITRGIVAGDTPSGQIEYWWSDAFLEQVQTLRRRVDRAQGGQGL